MANIKKLRFRRRAGPQGIGQEALRKINSYVRQRGSPTMSSIEIRDNQVYENMELEWSPEEYICGKAKSRTRS